MKFDKQVFAAPLIAAILFAAAVSPVAAADAASAAVVTQQDMKAQLIIRNADRVRAPDQPFRYTLRLEEFRNGKSATQQDLDVSMRFHKPGEDRSDQGD